MNRINGRVICLNRESQLAAIDIGLGEAIVIEFPVNIAIAKGDSIENLVSRYGKVSVTNTTRSTQFSSTVLSGGIPKTTALYVVNGDLNAVA